MKILFVIEGLQESCGVSRFVIEMTRELNEMGERAAIVTTKNWNIENVKNIYELDSPEKVTKQFWPDIVHINGCWNYYLHKMCLWCKNNSVRYIFSPHGAWTEWALQYHSLRKKLVWWLYQKSDCITANSFHATGLSEYHDIRRLGFKKTIVIAPLGVRMPKCRIKAKEKDNMILYLGRIHEKKNVHGLVNIWNSIPNSITASWTLVIAGKPIREDNDYYNSIQRIAKDNCLFIGEVIGDKKNELLRKAKILILPSFSENFGSVVIEALSYGTPVIATKGTPWSDLIKYHCGWHVSLYNDELEKAILQSMQLNATEYSAMVFNAQKFVENSFSWRVQAKKLLSEYKNVLCHNRY